MSTMTIVRTIRQVPDDSGRMHTLDGATTYSVDGVPIEHWQARNWFEGTYQPPSVLPPVEDNPLEGIEPGIYAIMADPEGVQPRWKLQPGYPLGVALQASRTLADTSQIPQYVIDEDMSIYVIIPDPDSAQRMVEPNTKGPDNVVYLSRRAD